MSENIIPAVWAAGKFEAEAPFNQIVKADAYYTVEAVRTVSEMLALKVDLYKLVFQPAGVAQENYQDLLDNAKSLNAVVITLTSKNAAPVYVLSNYLKSFPLVDGVIYERVCIIADLGACPPTLKDRINSATDHFKNYLKDSVGIANARVTIGTVPQRAYVSKEQAQIWENSRQLAITSEPSDLLNLETANKTIIAQRAYITQLENQLKK
ncbi:hypothetical protein PQD71_gp196 [Kosakonia phage Kc263]|uniref:Uncharacterized protein n=1 Tax=Kosakonia phage Kc263 TaxID=2863194 RepID=A0AAE7WFX2_9CAUD|nr:hypothetical protein PQD71_gp196 [Kosakonia phage Kc263]QYN80130.1 hypothetical protein [Kosakonia phage Kc263]